jgi:hypothetical protein
MSLLQPFLGDAIWHADFETLNTKNVIHNCCQNFEPHSELFVLYNFLFTVRRGASERQHDLPDLHSHFGQTNFTREFFSIVDIRII